MKYNKAISITLFNSFVLLVLSSLMVSCDNKKIHTKGMLTNFTPSNSRGIASVSPTLKQKKFIHFQDPKQIIIYCANSTKKSELCYEQNFRGILHSYNKKFGPLDNNQIKLIKEHFNYDKTKLELTKLDKKITKILNGKISKTVIKREKFCKQNSKKFLKKCLTQYLTRDTFSVLNQFQVKNEKMNSHEYLYYKRVIENNFKQKLEISFKELK